MLGFRWDCEQSAQVWQQCASLRIVDNTAPAPPPELAPLCGDLQHGCLLRQDVWSATNICLQSKDHCENGTIRR
eukprot:SAG31_NODE_18738_length_624_cov_1.472381_2_plen_73_part_01